MKNYKADVQSRLYIDQMKLLIGWQSYKVYKLEHEAHTYTLNQIIYVMCIFELAFAFKRTI